MNQNEHTSDLVEFDAVSFMSHGKRVSGDEDESLPWGKVSKKRPMALRVHGQQGKAGFSYHGYAGHDEEDGSFTVYFGKAIVGGIDGSWWVKVSGQKLDKALDFFLLNWLAVLREGGTVEGDDPYIESIKWGAFVPAHPDD